MKSLIMFALLSVSSIVYANPANNRILDLSVSGQEDIFKKAVQTSGKSCAYVIRVKYIGTTPVENEAMWAVKCPSESYMVTISPDVEGSTRMSECSMLKEFADVDCWAQ